MSARNAALGGAALGAATAAVAGRSPAAIVITGAFVALLAAVSVIDLRERRIPNVWTYPAVLLALIVSAVAGPGTLLLALGGFAVAGGFFALMFIVGRGRLGMGDVKLGAASGAVLGLAGAPAFLFLGTFAGALAASAMLLRGAGRTATFAYGPSLAVGAAIAILWQGPLVS